jgi:hypothetical protein
LPFVFAYPPRADGLLASGGPPRPEARVRLSQPDVSTPPPYPRPPPLGTVDGVAVGTIGTVAEEAGSTVVEQARGSGRG